MSEPIRLAPDATLGDAEALFAKHGFNALPVADEAGVLVGLLSTLDLLRAFDFAEEDILPSYEQVMTTPVSERMSRDVHTVRPRTPLRRVLSKMADAGMRSVPVVDVDRLVGMISRRDVMEGLRRGLAGERPWAEPPA